MANLTSVYTCSICNQLFDEATALKRCNHIFCWKCIHEKITQHDWQLCPVCFVEFGPDPLRRLSHDDPILVALETNNDDNDDDEDDDDDDDDDEDEDEDEDDDEDEDEDMVEDTKIVYDGSKRKVYADDDEDEDEDMVDATEIVYDGSKRKVYAEDEKQVPADSDEKKKSDDEKKEMIKRKKCDDGEDMEMGSKDSK